MFYADDVLPEVKSSRLTETIDAFQSVASERNTKFEIGRLHVVLVEGNAKKSSAERIMWTGRTDTNKRVVFADSAVLTSLSSENAADFRGLEIPLLSDVCKLADVASVVEKRVMELKNGELIPIEKGMYVVVKIISCKGHTLRGAAVAKTTIRESHSLQLPFII